MPNGDGHILRIACNVDANRGDENVILIEAGIGGTHVAERAQEEGGGNQQVTIQGTASGFGTILALNRNINFNPADNSSTSSGQGTWTGRLFGGNGNTITVQNPAVLTDPSLVMSSQTPEPPTVVLLLTALLVGLGIRRVRWRGFTRLQPALSPA